MNGENSNNFRKRKRAAAEVIEMLQSFISLYLSRYCSNQLISQIYVGIINAVLCGEGVI